MNIKRVLSNNHAELSVGSGPLLGHDVPDGQRVLRERERDPLGLAGGKGDTLEASENGRLVERKESNKMERGQLV